MAYAPPLTFAQENAAQQIYRLLLPPQMLLLDVSEGCRLLVPCVLLLSLTVASDCAVPILR